MPADDGSTLLHARWLGEALGAPLPDEPRATCGDCAMRRDPAADIQFSSTKCCTFFPELPAFAVGRLLLDEDPGLAEGRARVLARIAEGQQVTPLGIGRPVSYLAVYGGSETFGVAHALRCPYFVEEGGRCSVWRHREGVCATWFCKHERGALGFHFWTAARRLLKHVEKMLSRELALELGIDEAALDALASTPQTLDRRWDPELFAAIWGPWSGREGDYYQACGRAVDALSWSDIRDRLGGLEEHLGSLRRSFAPLAAAPRIPELVRIRVLRRAGGDPTRVLLDSYSPFDPVEVPEAVADALHDIDGRPVGVVLDRGAAAGVDRALLERLWEFGLIEDASE